MAQRGLAAELDAGHGPRREDVLAGREIRLETGDARGLRRLQGQVPDSELRVGGPEVDDRASIRRGHLQRRHADVPAGGLEDDLVVVVGDVSFDAHRQVLELRVGKGGSGNAKRQQARECEMAACHEVPSHSDHLPTPNSMP